MPDELSVASPVSPGAVAPCDPKQLEEHLAAIDLARDEWDTKAFVSSRSRRRFGIVAAVAGPLAVVPLIVQVVAFPTAGPLALGLILIELAVLGGLLLVGFAHIGPSQDTWMRHRVRAEALRRERFLVLARVGPYLDTPDPCAMIDHRIAHLTGEATEPHTLILLEDRDGTLWQDRLEESVPGATASPDPLCLEEFRQKRVEDQEGWYLRKSGTHERDFHLLESVVRATLIGAVVLSALHLASLYWGGDRHDAARPMEMLALELVALILPNVGAAAAALQTFLESRRLARTYRSQARRLQVLGDQLVALRACGESPVTAHRLKRLVLHVESLLAEELHQWWLHAYR